MIKEYAYKARAVIAKQLDRIQRISPIMALILLVINISISIVGSMGWRGHPYLMGLTSLVLVSALIIIFAWLWAGPLDMIRTVRNVQAFHDPMQTYQLTPKETLLWRWGMIPQLKTQMHILLKLDMMEDAKILEEQLVKLHMWEEKGFIDKSDFPDDLKKYYYGGKQ